MKKQLLDCWKTLIFIIFNGLEKFAKYDYGYSGNMRRYNSKTPPEYNLAKVTVPTFILHSRNDRLSAKAVIIVICHLSFTVDNRSMD